MKHEISSQDGSISQVLNGTSSSAPVFARRRITTQALVPSSYTLVLGGLEQDIDTKNFTKVPFLGDLPGLGYLFRYDSKGRNKDNILIFVTPTIISDSDYQTANTRFLKTKAISPSDAEEALTPASPTIEPNRTQL